MRAFQRPLGPMRLAGLVDEAPDAVLIIGLPRDQDRQVVSQADQPAIEHPMRRAGEGNPVADDIGTVRLDRPDMRGGDLRPPATIDQPQPRDRAALIIGPQDHLAENPVADDPGRDDADPLAALIKLHRRLLFLKADRGKGLADARQHGLGQIQAQRDDAVEIGRGDRADGRLGAAGDLPRLVQDAPLRHAPGVAEGNGIGEVEIASRLDQGEVHAGSAGVANDLLDLGDGKIAAGRNDLSGLVIDDPVVDAGLDPTKILAGKLVSLSGAVVVDRI